MKYYQRHGRISLIRVINRERRLEILAVNNPIQLPFTYNERPVIHNLTFYFATREREFTVFSMSLNAR